MNFGEKPKKRVTINITSLVDILIVLLLFFMLTTQFVHISAMRLNIMGITSENEEKADDGVIVITLIGGNKFIIEGNKFNLFQLQERIGLLLNNNKEKSIAIIIQNGVVVQEIVSAMDYIKMAGGKNISISEDADEYRK